MNQKIAQISLLVKDYDEAIHFYIEKLNFQIMEDTKLSETKRWLVIAPRGNSSCNLLLAKASGEEQISRIGNQTGGRVFLFLYTDDIDRDYKNLKENAVDIKKEPRIEPYGKVMVFSDLYGNLWDLIEPINKI